MSPTQARFVLLRATVRGDSGLAERVIAEAHASGASGLEERSAPDGSGTELLIYAPSAAIGALEEALRGLGAGDALSWPPPEPVPEEDWEERWKEGLGLVRVSPRLAVRPPFVDDDGSGVLVIEPGQAFGTGGHASTRLALVALDAWSGKAPASARVLDVGTGSGVLAIAALSVGAARAVAFDLDPLAAQAARANARANGCDTALLLFTGPITALGDAPFDCVLANLLRSELLPVLPEIARRIRPGGYAILAGLLGSDRGAVEAALGRYGLRVEGEHEEADADGTRWISLLARLAA